MKKYFPSSELIINSDGSVFHLHVRPEQLADKVILVGDAAMSSYELLSRGGNLDWYVYNKEPGIDWLKKLERHYKNIVWLNPIKKERWGYAWGSRTIALVREVFPMYELTLDGLDAAIQKLLSR